MNLYTQKFLPQAQLKLKNFEEKPAFFQNCVNSINENLQQKRLPALDILDLQQDIGAVREVCERFSKEFDEVIIMGTGGSSLGGKTLCELVQPSFSRNPSRPKVHFLDNIDSVTLDDLLRTFDFEHTGFVVISKSGTTAETLAQFLVVFEKAQRLLSKANLSNHFLVVTEPKSSPLADFAREHQLFFFPHHPQIGGRFSVFSVVGMIPALMVGVDVTQTHQGALEVLTDFENNLGTSNPALGAVYMRAHEQQNFRTHVMMPYCDRLQSFTAWHRQLWAESLGKQGRGTTPVRALGTVDQHSQLQLYLDGPQKDKFFTLLLLDQKNQGPKFSSKLLTDSRLDFFRNHCIGDLMQAEQEATIKSLENYKQSVRIFQISSLTETVLGGLLMHFMLETLVTAKLMDVNAFDQPAVEESKVFTRQALQRALAS